MNLETVTKEITEDTFCRFIWNNIKKGLAVVDKHGVILYANPAFADILGYSVSELQGTPFKEITAQEDIEPDLEEFERLLRGDTDHYSMVKTYWSKTNKPITCKLRVVSIEDGALVLGIVFPVEVVSMDRLSKEEQHKVIAMLVGTWAIDNWKPIIIFLVTAISLLRLDVILELLGGLS